MSDIKNNKSRFSFFCLASGSSGNSYYLGNCSYGILIDAGIGARTIKKRLKERGIDLSHIHSLLITHDHFDHVKSASYFADELGIPLYATKAVHEAMEASPSFKSKRIWKKKIVEKGVPFTINDFSFEAFNVPHDSVDNVGYHVRFGDHTFTLATDIGEVTDELRFYLKKSRHIVIESNYDEEMLDSGNYPEFLKNRIKSGKGHLSNQKTASLLASCFHEGIENIWLCHLSGKNNSPEITYKTIKTVLDSHEVSSNHSYSLTVFERNKLSDVVEFD